MTAREVTYWRPDDVDGHAAAESLMAAGDYVSAEVVWLDDVEGCARPLCGYVGTWRGRRIRWTYTHEAGIDDVELVEDSSAGDAALAQEYAEDIAAGFGTLARRASDQHHYTATGVQHQPVGYDIDGYREVYVPADLPDGDSGDWCAIDG